jgi:hypothetical protein
MSAGLALLFSFGSRAVRLAFLVEGVSAPRASREGQCRSHENPFNSRSAQKFSERKANSGALALEEPAAERFPDWFPPRIPRDIRLRGKFTLNVY